jgi:nucleoside-diphosphate-sugar epimerase
MVHTSSATVVIEQDNYNILGADESMPYARNHLDLYTITKHAAEDAVLANTKPGLLVFHAFLEFSTI